MSDTFSVIPSEIKNVLGGPAAGFLANNLGVFCFVFRNNDGRIFDAFFVTTA
jgi:hypothetical protein